MISNLFGTQRRRRIASASAAILFLVGGATSVFAFINGTGSGTQSVTVGGVSTLYTIAHCDAGCAVPNGTYSDPSGALVPGSTFSYHVKITNSSGSAISSPGGTLHLSSVTADASHSACNSTAQPTWFSQPDVAWTGPANMAAGATTQVPSSNLSFVVFSFINDPSNNQGVCAGATLTLNLTTA